MTCLKKCKKKTRKNSKINKRKIMEKMKMQVKEIKYSKKIFLNIRLNSYILIVSIEMLKENFNLV
jgi:hypothetical protein